MNEIYIVVIKSSIFKNFQEIKNNQINKLVDRSLIPVSGRRGQSTSTGPNCENVDVISSGKDPFVCNSNAILEAEIILA